VDQPRPEQTGHNASVAWAPIDLGHSKLESSVRDLGAEVDDALEIAENI
jgi:hypothetical protein